MSKNKSASDSNKPDVVRERVSGAEMPTPAMGTTRSSRARRIRRGDELWSQSGHAGPGDAGAWWWA